MERVSAVSRELPRGSIVALITPFTPEGMIDRRALRKLVDFHVRSGTAGIVVAGTTGEASTLTHVEHRELIAATVEYSNGRTHVMAGVGANSTAEAVDLARFAEEAGADSLLSVVPYYIKPSQEGLVEHFVTQADASGLPLVLYNVPGRTVTDLAVSTVRRLAGHPNICGIKDATGDMARAAELVEMLPSSFALYSGDDFTSMAYLALGGWGVISVVANIYPRKVANLCSLIASNDLARARQHLIELLPLTRALFAETNPGPVKFAASLLGHCEPFLRLPMVIPERSLQHAIRECVKAGVENDS
ncbi:4-hydroxy-tetrahydrodipicolinate synthase [Paraburkholderia guartelaensis]|uniref:4-hydroxy-tetrahydrodipicolinate synthase n=1 Tax=Paraburkholderia guartelaensis TaxID=2546446 RepID=UPI002AB6CB50|nr:4-hydroxy-tetrahydrodipicolinate synthase [Paraburkholderia guartelaensis]